MTDSIASYSVRDLDVGEFELLPTIDRAERIDVQYVVHDGELRAVECAIHVTGWAPGEVASYVARLGDLHAAGGVVLGAMVDAALVALASLDVRPVASMPTVLKLDMLFVSAPYRHRGIGRQLTSRLAERARSLGATGLCVSATPTRNTVDAYRSMGATVLTTPRPWAPRP
jgi:GNAT superfamily N-acetyltransferase